MIGFLSGTISDISAGELILDINGVGYLVKVPRGYEQKVTLDSQAKFFIHTFVKEDDISLYGFESRSQLLVFKLLISVSGVGPKMAMNIMGKGNAEAIQKAVAEADVSFFTSISGIGKKNGQRIIVDLKSKLGSLQELDLGTGESIDDLQEALVQMGFDKERVRLVLKAIDKDLPEQKRIKLALQQLSANQATM